MQKKSWPTSRRDFLALLGSLSAQALVSSLGFSATPQRASATDAVDAPPAAVTTHPFESSKFVYISPLLASGQESSCHAELWYAWLDGRIVVNVASDRWKATALARGLDRAHVWVGDHGRWKGRFGGRNEAFRQSPRLVAKVEKLDGPKTVDRLLSAYELKYPAEIASWRERMKKGVADGSRVLLAYRIND